VKGETIPTTIGELDFTLRQPFGVVARITAFNHPALFSLKAISAPVVAGNTVVLKPSPHTPLSTIRIAEIADEILPPGVVNLATGGSEAALALARHPLVRRLSLTGSYQAGLAITRAAAEHDVKVISLENGGKNPIIVLPDADVTAAVDGVVNGMNFTSSAGQSCGSTSRLFVHDDIYGEVLDAVAEEMAAMRPGDPLDEESDMGPLISRAQLDKTERHVGAAREEGAHLVTGGRRPDLPGDLANGYFYLPTLFDDVAPASSLAREEIFGPVLAAFRWRDLDEVIEAANDVEYGLTASVWTNDLERAITLAKRIDAGYVWINGSSHHQFGSPFGGFKNSGTGREESFDELLSYTQIKNVNIRFAPRR
jgi:acyl-CoA reductase-like NAD-dependent aldehyde dehydrogenase